MSKRSLNDEVSQNQMKKNTKTIASSPKFLIVARSEEGKDFLKKSPFYIRKAIEGIISNVLSVKRCTIGLSSL
jgi:hypothetical protein